MTSPTLFDQPATMPEVNARARRTDPSTSHQAAASVHKTNETHQRILSLLLSRDLTDEEIAAEWERCYPDVPASPSGLRSRRAELVSAGIVFDSGGRRKTASGRATAVWTRLRP